MAKPKANPIKPTNQPLDPEPEIKLPKNVRTELEDAIKLRARAKGMESEAKILNESAKATLLPLMAAYSIKKYAVAGVGTVITKVSVGSSIDVVKLRENMLIAGIQIEAIEMLIDQSTKRWSTEYVEFKADS